MPLPHHMIGRMPAYMWSNLSLHMLTNQVHAMMDMLCPLCFKSSPSDPSYPRSSHCRDGS